MNDAGQLGYVCALSEAVLVDASNVSEFELSRDHIGELCVRGPGVVMGYVRDDGIEQESINESISSKRNPLINLVPVIDDNGYYRTGDLCRRNTDGSASFVRRAGLVVKL